MGSLFLVMFVLHASPAEAATQRVHTFSGNEFVFALEVEQRPSADDASVLCEPKSVTVRRKPDGQGSCRSWPWRASCSTAAWSLARFSSWRTSTSMGVRTSGC